MPDPYILHICSINDWQEAQARGEYRPASLEEDGFIHFSPPEQIAWVANTFFQGRTDLVLLWVDPARAGAEIRWESVDGENFPHLYGPLNLDAVVKVQLFIPDEEGLFKDS